MRSKAKSVFWRICSNEQNFAIKLNTDYSFHTGYRYYKVGTNTSTGYVTRIADSIDMTFRFDLGRIMVVGPGAVAALVFVLL